MPKAPIKVGLVQRAFEWWIFRGSTLKPGRCVRYKLYHDPQQKVGHVTIEDQEEKTASGISFMSLLRSFDFWSAHAEMPEWKDARLVNRTISSRGVVGTLCVRNVETGEKVEEDVENLTRALHAPGDKVFFFRDGQRVHAEIEKMLNDDMLVLLIEKDGEETRLTLAGVEV